MLGGLEEAEGEALLGSSLGLDKAASGSEPVPLKSFSGLTVLLVEVGVTQLLARGG